MIHRTKRLLPFLRGASAAPATSADDAAAPDGTCLTLGRHEARGEKSDSQATDLTTSVTVVGSDQLANESVDNPLELLGKKPVFSRPISPATAAPRAAAITRRSRNTASPAKGSTPAPTTAGASA
jgi:hypothetical protein